MTILDTGRKKMKPSPFPMIQPEEATRIVIDLVTAPGSDDLEEVPLIAGKGRILAEDIYSSVNIPAFDTTPIDGYALIAEEGRQQWQITGESLAGQPSGLSVEPGTAVRIMNGAPLPQGADTVVMVEFTRESDNCLEVTIPLRPGENIRPTGQDVRVGQLVLKAGTLMGAPELGLVGTVNLSSFKAYRKPRLAIISVGNEIAEPGGTYKPGMVYDANRYGLVAAVQEAYATPVPLGIAPADREGLRKFLLEALQDYDGVITSGSASVGKTDIVKDLMEEIGKIHFGRVNLKPGKPFSFVTVEVNGVTKPVFALPGSPVASLVSFELFVRPAVLKMGGHQNLYRPVVQVQVEHDIKHAADRNEFVRAIVRLKPAWDNQSYRYSARTTGAQESSRLLSMIEANALLKVAPGPEPLKAGSYVSAVLFGQVNVSEF